MTKKQLAIAFTFLLIIAHLFRRWKHMQKSLVWKGFLSESLQIENYRNLSLFNKLVFWMNYPIFYVGYLWVVVWDRIDRLSFKENRSIWIFFFISLLRDILRAYPKNKLVII